MKKNNLVLMGTAGVVALSTPRWLMRLAGLVGLERFSKLDTAIGKADNSRFLESGDQVIVSGDWLGSVGVTMSNENRHLLSLPSGSFAEPDAKQSMVASPGEVLFQHHDLNSLLNCRSYVSALLVPAYITGVGRD